MIIVPMNLCLDNMSLVRTICVTLNPFVFERAWEISVNGLEQSNNIRLGLTVLERAINGVAVLDNAHVVAVMEERVFWIYRGDGCSSLQK
jgi:hypothetical protein